MFSAEADRKEMLHESSKSLIANGLLKLNCRKIKTNYKIDYELSNTSQPHQSVRAQGTIATSIGKWGM